METESLKLECLQVGPMILGIPLVAGLSNASNNPGEGHVTCTW